MQSTRRTFLRTGLAGGSLLFLPRGLRARGRLEWDPVRGRVTNSAAADAFIGPGHDYRQGWGV